MCWSLCVSVCVINPCLCFQSFSLVQDLLLEIQELKESRDQLKEKVEEQHTALEKVCYLLYTPPPDPHLHITSWNQLTCNICYIYIDNISIEQIE